MFPTCLPLVLMAQDQSWLTKPAAEWTRPEAESILSNSPWAKPNVPTMVNSGTEQKRSQHGAIGSGTSPGGLRVGGIGIRGMGSKRGAMNHPSSPSEADGSDSSATAPPTLLIRWESAVPVQIAHLKLADPDGPSIEEACYTIAILNIPEGAVKGDAKDLEKRLKNQGEITAGGRKPVHSSEVRVLDEDNGRIILFKFPKTYEITAADETVVFGADLGGMKLLQSFVLKEMVFEGKLEL